MKGNQTDRQTDRQADISDCRFVEQLKRLKSYEIKTFLLLSSQLFKPFLLNLLF